jgi:hypothetical protein
MAVLDVQVVSGVGSGQVASRLREHDHTGLLAVTVVARPGFAALVIAVPGSGSQAMGGRRQGRAAARRGVAARGRPGDHRSPLPAGLGRPARCYRGARLAACVRAPVTSWQIVRMFGAGEPVLHAHRPHRTRCQNRRVRSRNSQSRAERRGTGLWMHSP